ncbi:hypothetical protein, partial [Streptomyces sp. SP18BB07]|uniref:hypothetical protein n=1 Tax=Streptomyces sp. SP18BB07 TaxID=3002522 RepID=UPI003FCC7350
MLNTDAGVYGGTDVTASDPVNPEPLPWGGRPARIRVTLTPLTTHWLRPACSSSPPTTLPLPSARGCAPSTPTRPSGAGSSRIYPPTSKTAAAPQPVR